jgi:hypothetical protein
LREKCAIHALKRLEGVEHVAAATAHDTTLANIELIGRDLELCFAVGADRQQHGLIASTDSRQANPIFITRIERNIEPGPVCLQYVFRLEGKYA